MRGKFRLAATDELLISAFEDVGDVLIRRIVSPESFNDDDLWAELPNRKINRVKSRVLRPIIMFCRDVNQMFCSALKNGDIRRREGPSK